MVRCRFITTWLLIVRVLTLIAFALLQLTSVVLTLIAFPLFFVSRCSYSDSNLLLLFDLFLLDNPYFGLLQLLNFHRPLSVAFSFFVFRNNFFVFVRLNLSFFPIANQILPNLFFFLLGQSFLHEHVLNWDWPGLLLDLPPQVLRFSFVRCRRPMLL